MSFDKKIALFDQEVASKEEALKLLANEFVKAGVVEDNFYDGIIAREANFPTGLDLGDVGVAIPHTDPEYVKSTQIGFMTLKNPVIFTDMGNLEHEIKVNFIFMMAIKEAHGQIEMLQKLMGLFMEEELVKKLLTVKDYDSYYEVIKEAKLVD